jgi:hypothetical protein
LPRLYFLQFFTFFNTLQHHAPSIEFDDIAQIDYFEPKESEYFVAFVSLSRLCGNLACAKMADEENDEWNGFSDEDDAFRAEKDNEAIPIYPEGGALLPDGSTARAETIDDLHKALNAHGKAYGYAIIRRNGRDVINGKPTTYNFFCDRYGEPRPSCGVGLRKTKTRKTGCKFRGIASLSEDDGWVFKHHEDPQHHIHNHPPSLDSSAHPQHRKLASPVKNIVKKMAPYSAIRAREISGLIQQDYPDSVHTIKDINNARQALRRQEKDGCTASGALIKAFDEEGVFYTAKWDEEDPDRLLGLVFTFPESIDTWQRFLDCLSMDNTYCTNVLGFPLFVVTTQTNINSTANLAFGLIDNERREGFDFLAQGINDLRIKVEARSPYVIVTDKDDQIKGALLDVFPDAQQQICRFHINKNVHLKAKTKGKWPRRQAGDDPEGLLDV